MSTAYTIQTQTDPSRDTVVLLLNGKFGEDALPELERSIAAAKHARRRVDIDLSEVTLLDRAIARYFSERASNGVRLVNCPNYLRQWIPQVINETE
jgi:anti-anti-sigma regulatory factor